MSDIQFWLIIKKKIYNLSYILDTTDEFQL